MDKTRIWLNTQHGQKLYPFAFTFQEVSHRIGKVGVRQPVGAGGLNRQKGTRHFVFTLGAAFKTLVTVVNTPLQRLVIAGLKMQAVHSFDRTPVTSIRYLRCIF